jgi:hypothetical protein
MPPEREWEPAGCANCGVAINPRRKHGSLVLCEHCGAVFRQSPEGPTPQPTLGDLLLGADFRDPALPGWVVSRPEQVEFRPGSPAELWASLPASELIHPVVRTPGPFDDVDAGVTIRFISGVYEYISAGFEVRAWDDGDYVVRLSAQGTFAVGWHAGSAWGGELVGWTNHPVLRTEWGAANRLRVVGLGNQLRIYLNGMLAASLRDDRFHRGRVRLVMVPGGQGPATAAFSDLQLRAPCL